MTVGRKCLLLLVMGVSSSCGGTPVSDAVVEQLRIRLVVHADGAIDVDETLIVRGFARPSPFERHLERRRVDRVADVRAAVLDAAASESTARVDVDRSGDVRVRWPDVAGEQGRTLHLQYRLVGALEVHGARAWVRYRLVPLAPAYPVAEASVELEWPAAAPVVEAPATAGADWTFVHSPAGARATRRGIAPGETAVLSAAMDIHALPTLVPAWQQNADRAREMAPAFLIGAFFILVTGAGAVIMVWVQYPKRRAVAGVRASVRQVAGGLLATGLVLLGIAALSGAAAALVIERYGRAIATIPGSIVIVGLLMLVAGLLLRRRDRT